MASKESVPRSWRILQIIIFILTFFAGAVAFIPLSFVTHNLGSCMLFGVINYSLVYNHTANKSWETTVLHLNYPSTHWAYLQACEYSTYVNVASTIFSFILCWFFLVCTPSKNGSGIPKPWRIVLPALIISSIVSLLDIVGSYIITKGFQFLCEQIEKGEIKNCRDAQKVIWDGLPSINGFFDQLFISMVGSWMTTGLWILASVLLFSRCLLKVDFRKYKAVKTQEPHSEERWSPKGTPSHIQIVISPPQ